ncbi:hypothetical protein GWN26_15655, partial [Candidatus Saccharibacteria bacterium]|nr:hypothetical protein [Candidatus Saccharibacteria bacterium]NIV04538.1 hypothetical protein [Calditrichia bacterium]NIV73137.1 hypothetical protein [Calditrichia bacterium]NIW00475.1 hypothetical protein [Candidatus Saccharibacteria bacterium]NIW80816.1 hypothetical protein [Calditrichia bacterium]
MGFSVSAATLLIFIGIIIATSAIYGAWSYGYDQITDANNKNIKTTLNQKQTSIKIQNWTYDGNTLSINITNTGNTGLNVNRTTLITDGKLILTTTKTVKNHESSNNWLPDETLIL